MSHGDRKENMFGAYRIFDIHTSQVEVPADYSTCSHVYESETAINAQAKKGEKDKKREQ